MAKNETDELRERRKEFFDNVWDHSIDVFQAQFDERRSLTKEEVKFLERVEALLKSIPDNASIGEEIYQNIQANPDKLLILLQICGLTRSKIISDLAASARTRGMKFPSALPALARNKAAWQLAGPYLVARLRRVLGALPNSMEALNQATWPGYIRQERAKRSGHEAEYRLAVLLTNCGIPFEPQEKAVNPLCPDAQIDGVSFDLIIPSTRNPKVCVKATVHIANIGQYGESKDDLEIREARQLFEKKFEEKQQPILLALIDGIGFKSNSAGLNGVLSNSDEFCQFRTIWKAVLLASVAAGKTIDIELPEQSIREQGAFIRRYNYLGNIVPMSKRKKINHRIEAGEGNILFETLPSAKG